MVAIATDADPAIGLLDPAVPTDALVGAATRFGTPAYVLDVAAIHAAALLVERAFARPWRWQYSLKANDLPAIAALLAERGWGANVVSSGEWRYAQAAGVTNGATSLEGIGKTDADLENAVVQAAQGRPLRWVALESGDEAARLTELARLHGLGRDGRPPLDVLLRLNPGVDPETRAEFAVGASGSKFGMALDEARTVAASGLADAGLRLRGIHVHAGSDLGDVSAWAQAGCAAVRLADELRHTHDSIDTVDLGGGFPAPVEDNPRPEEFARALDADLARHGLTLPPHRAIEPGRLLVGHAGWLVAKVLHARPRGDADQQVVIDAGMTELVRPALYGSRHPIHGLTADGEPIETAVEGPICELTDSFGRHRLPRLRRGDLVAIGNAGAYAASFTSRYNGRPQPREVLLQPHGSLDPATRP